MRLLKRAGTQVVQLRDVPQALRLIRGDLPVLDHLGEQLQVPEAALRGAFVDNVQQGQTSQGKPQGRWRRGHRQSVPRPRLERRARS